MKTNNKGFSLVEVVVVVAVSSIVLLLITGMLVNSTRMTGRETSVISIQNENQLIVNNMTVAFMEATKLDISSNANGVMVDLGDYEAVSVPGPSGSSILEYHSKSKVDCRRIFYDKNSDFLALIANSSYLTDTFSSLASKGPKSPAPDDNFTGYCLSEIVNYFSVSVDPECRSTNTIVYTLPDGSTYDDYYYVNPIKVVLTYQLKNYGTSDLLSTTVELRNNLSEIVVDNGTGAKTYKVFDK